MGRYVVAVLVLVTILADVFTEGTAHALTYALGVLSGMCVVVSWRR